MQRQQAGRPPHWPQTTPECTTAAAHIGQANQMSLATTAQPRTIIWCGRGGLLANGDWLGLGGGLLLCSRALLSTLIGPGASEIGYGGWAIRSSSGGRWGVSASSIGSPRGGGGGGGGGPWGTTWSSEPAAAGGGGGGGGLVGILGSLFLPAKVASSVVDISTHLSSTRCSAYTTTLYRIRGMTVKAWYSCSAMILGIIGVPDNWMTNPRERWYICTKART
jgi:hypothetical protein